MNTIGIIRGITSHAAGAGAGMLVRRAIDTLAPITRDQKKIWRITQHLGRYTLIAIAVDTATEQMKKEIDEVVVSASGMVEAVQAVKTDQTFRDIADRLTDDKDKKD